MSARAEHVPERRCVSCRRVRPQRELLRFYQDGGVWQLDAARRAGGRGAWVCADSSACWELKGLKRAFRAQAEQVYTLLQARGAGADDDRAGPKTKMEA